jgi:threonyl-tRNA synthetase
MRFARPGSAGPLRWKEFPGRPFSGALDQEVARPAGPVEVPTRSGFRRPGSVAPAPRRTGRPGRTGVDPVPRVNPSDLAGIRNLFPPGWVGCDEQMDVSPRVRIELPDHSVVEVPVGTPAGQILRGWRPGEADRYLAATLDRVPIDLDRALPGSGSLAPLTVEDPAGREVLHHSAAHLVAKAVIEVVAGARPTVGPPTDDGFYYDFDMRPLTPEDLPKIRTAIDAALRARERFERAELSREEAERLFASNPHKLRYIAEAPPNEPISVYRTGDFVDLCRGPHVPDTGWLRGIHILGFSGVTMGGTPDGLPLQRVRGVAFATRPELEVYLRQRAEAEARDHRVLGQRLELFSFVDESPGFPLWHPNGMIVVRELERYVTEHLARAGYSEIRTPLMFARSVFETSGHMEHYRADMFMTAIEDREFGIKPMNCPGSMLIFRSRARSYRELPMRLAEFAPLHRLEASGTIHGMTRVREFIQDDAHIFVTEDQIAAEVQVLLEWVRDAFTTFHLDWTYELSTRPDHFLGEAATWDRAEAILEQELKRSGIHYRVAAGEGAFYGPKIDIHIRDSLGRPWQTGTIQLDYQLPTRFGLEYQGPDGALHTPIVIHRTILGSWERFVGVLLEHCGGRLPPWLAPVQVRILPLADRHDPPAQGLRERLRAEGIRAEVVASVETLSKRVRQSEVDRVPYVAVLGDQEVSGGSVALRVHGQKGQRSLAEAEFIRTLVDRVRRRSYDP